MAYEMLIFYVSVSWLHQDVLSKIQVIYSRKSTVIRVCNRYLFCKVYYICVEQTYFILVLGLQLYEIFML